MDRMYGKEGISLGKLAKYGIKKNTKIDRRVQARANNENRISRKTI